MRRSAQHFADEVELHLAQQAGTDRRLLLSAFLLGVGVGWLLAVRWA